MTHRIPQKGYSALFLLVEQIDLEISRATVTSKQFVTFKAGRASFTIKKTFARLEKFRESVIKNRKAFSDIALQIVKIEPRKENIMDTTQHQPALERALAVLHTSMGKPAPITPTVQQIEPRMEKAVAQATPPRKPKTKAAPQPARDVWFYFDQQRARAERRAA